MVSCGEIKETEELGLCVVDIKLCVVGKGRDMG